MPDYARDGDVNGRPGSSSFRVFWNLVFQSLDRNGGRPSHCGGWCKIRKTRTIAAALVLCLWSASSASAQPLTIPVAERARIHAVLSPYDYYPAHLPAGLIFASWNKTRLSPTACGTDVNIEFAGSGRLTWSSSRSCISNGRIACSSSGYPGYGFFMAVGEQTAMINSRRVHFSVGNHGSNAWACIPLRVNGSADMAVVGIWESNFMTPHDAMQLVAYARP